MNVPTHCPKCGRSMVDRTGGGLRSWRSYLGHLGLHGLADHHFSGDVKAAWKAFTLHPVVPFHQSKQAFHNQNERSSLRSKGDQQ